MMNINDSKSAVHLINKLAAILLLIVSLIFLLLTLLFLTGNINHFIHSDFKKSGILKILGFSPGNIILTYIIQCFIISIFFTGSGLLSCYSIIKLYLTSLEKSWGMPESFPYHFFFPAALTFLFFITVIYLIAFYKAHKAGKLKPGAVLLNSVLPLSRTDRESINKGIGFRFKMYKHDNGAGSITRLSLPMFIGFRNMFVNRKEFLLTIVSFTVTISISVLAINTYFSLQKLFDQNFSNIETKPFPLSDTFFLTMSY